MTPDQITVTDTLGQTFSAADCEIICFQVGENDYSDPVGLRFPDGETVVFSDDLNLADPSGNAVDICEISFSGEWIE